MSGIYVYMHVHVRDDVCLHGFTSLHTLRCVRDEERTGVYQHVLGLWMCQHTLYGTLRYRLPSHRVTGLYSNEVTRVLM